MKRLSMAVIVAIVTMWLMFAIHVLPMTFGDRPVKPYSTPEAIPTHLPDESERYIVYEGSAMTSGRLWNISLLDFNSPQTFDCLWEHGVYGYLSYVQGEQVITITGHGGPFAAEQPLAPEFGTTQLTNDVDQCLNEEHTYGAIRFAFYPPVRAVRLAFGGVRIEGEHEHHSYGYCYFGQQYSRPVGRYYLGPAAYDIEIPPAGSFTDGAAYQAFDREGRAIPYSGVTYCDIFGIVDNVSVVEVE